MKALLIVLPLLFLIATGTVLAQTASDFNYRFNIFVKNDSTENITDKWIAVPVNPSALETIGTEWLVTDSSGNSIPFTIQNGSPTVDATYWWISADSIPAGQERRFPLYLDSTTSWDYDFGLASPDSITVLDDDSLDITSDLLIEVLDAIFTDTAPAGTFMTGGAVSTSGGQRIHTFTSSDTLTVVNGGEVEYLVVAGGGGGGGSGQQAGDGGGGGGGAGGYLAGSVSIDVSQAITVGTGGAGGTTDINGTPGDQGVDSSIGTLVEAIGGGGGGSDGGAGSDGGSGGGGFEGQAGRSGTPGQGNDGGNGGGDDNGGGGGGGSSGVGAVGGSATGGAGGAGTSNDISGSSVTYAVGGAGGDEGGIAAGANGTDGTGNGGQGGERAAGGDGGDGIVIVSYAEPSDRCLVCKASAYELTISDEQVSATIYIGSTPTTVSATISEDVEVDIRATYDGATLALLLDGSTAASDSVAGAIDTNANDVSVNTISGTLGNIAIASGGVDALDLDFEPANITQTQEGSVGNDWNWLGTITDQSGEGNDGTYTLVRDMSEVTVTKGAIEPLFDTSASALRFEVGDVFGDIPVPDIQDLDTANLPFASLMQTTATSMDLRLQALYILMWGGISLLLGIVASRLLREDWVGVILFDIFLIGGALSGMYNLGIALLVVALIFGVKLWQRALRTGDI